MCMCDGMCDGMYVCVMTYVCVMACVCVMVCVCVMACMYVHSVYGCLQRPDISTPLSSRNLPRRQHSNLIKARVSPKFLPGHLAVPGEWGVLPAEKKKGHFLGTLGGRSFPKVPGK